MPRGEGGPFGDGRDALWGLPVSVKDCFDLAGAPTSCGVHFYRDLNGIAARDSWLVERLRAAGRGHHRQDAPASSGLRHHRRESRIRRLPAAGRSDCALTGGSSSGAAASVLEGSAVAAIGTDTGRLRPRACRALRAGRSIEPRSGAATGAAVRTWRNPSTPWAGSFAILKMRRCWPVSSRPELVGPRPPFTRFAVVADELSP